MATLTDTCCTKAPGTCPTDSKGSIIQIGDLSVFVAGPSDAKVAAVGVYDIFGDHPSTRKFCETFGNDGVRVFLPDLCRGKPWPSSKFPLSSELMPEFLAWVKDSFSYEAMKADITTVLEHANKEGYAKVVIFGFCAGAKVAAGFAEAGIAAGWIGLHPSFVNDDDSKAFTCPALVIPSKNEADMKPFMENIPEPYKADSAHHRFDDVEHGFCGARGDWNGGVYTQRATEAAKLSAEFTHRVSSPRL